MTDELDIAWSLPEPPVQPAGWRRWGVRPVAELADGAVESGLGWPTGTLAVLRQAFKQRLGRSMGWEDSVAADSPVRAAAFVFKRGVAWRPAGGEFAQAQHAGRYRVHVHPAGGSLPAPLLAALDPEGFAVVDARVARLWPDVPWPRRRVELALDEHGKTLDAVSTLLAAARAAGSPRHWTIVAGGLLSDVAAFAAPLAGAEFTLVPTTLLAMADACVGGKTGVNFPPFGKNQLGLFRFPRAVHAWPGWLATLPPREVRAGGAECLKHAFLTGDGALAASLALALQANDVAKLASHLRAVIAVKAAVVAADPGETAQRATLNLGHTLGHALEAASQKATTGEATLLHGEAVGLGLAFALKLSRRVTGLSADAEAQMTAQLRRAGCLLAAAALRRSLGGRDLAAPALLAELKAFIGHDKKIVAGAAPQWVLLAAPGFPAAGPDGQWTVPAPEREVDGAWADFLAELA